MQRPRRAAWQRNGWRTVAICLQRVDEQRSVESALGRPPTPPNPRSRGILEPRSAGARQRGGHSAHPSLLRMRVGAAPTQRPGLPAFLVLATSWSSARSLNFLLGPSADIEVSTALASRGDFIRRRRNQWPPLTTVSLPSDGPSSVLRGGSRRGDRVRRSDFVTLVGGTAAWPLIARA